MAIAMASLPNTHEIYKWKIYIHFSDDDDDGFDEIKEESKAYVKNLFGYCAHTHIHTYDICEPIYGWIKATTTTRENFE